MHMSTCLVFNTEVEKRGSAKHCEKKGGIDTSRRIPHFERCIPPGFGVAGTGRAAEAGIGEAGSGREAGAGMAAAAAAATSEAAAAVCWASISSRG